MEGKLKYEDYKKRINTGSPYSERRRGEYGEKCEKFLEVLDATAKATLEKGGRLIGLFDYDCDGIMSALTAKLLYPELEVHIGDRYVDEYGIIKDLSFLKKGDLVICGDIGSTEKERVCEIAGLTGNYPFIIDHHEVSRDMDRYPRLLNFCKTKWEIPMKERPDWSTTGLMFQLLYARLSKEEVLYTKKLYLGALYNMCGTTADMVSINNPYDTNREDVKFAFDIMNNEENLEAVDSALTYFFKRTGLLDIPHMTTDALSFNINPVINALGRIGTLTDYGVTGGQFIFDTLDSTNGFDNAIRETRINECLEVNEKRKEMERAVYNSDEYKSYVEKFNGKVAVMYIPDLHRGICGLVAQKLATTLGVPAICICGEGDKVVGSARNVAGYPDMLAITDSLPVDSLKCGGHPDAFGFRMDRKDIQKLCKELGLKYVSIKPEKKEYPTADLKDFTVTKLLSLEPFGTDFPKPEVSERFTVNTVNQYRDGWTSINEKGIKFFGKGEGIEKGDTVEINGSLGVNFFAGKESLQVSFDTIGKQKEVSKESEEEDKYL